jgi:hypothetical protein
LHDLFGVTKFEDFACTGSADKDTVSGYEADENNGPDVEDLLIDFRGKLNSKWNLRVINLMSDYFVDNLKNLEPVGQLPQRSNAYFEDIIRDYIQSAMTPWRAAQPKLLEVGRLESPAEVERRLSKGKKRNDQRARANTRRIDVSLWR